MLRIIQINMENHPQMGYLSIHNQTIDFIADIKNNYIGHGLQKHFYLNGLIMPVLYLKSQVARNLVPFCRGTNCGKAMLSGTKCGKAKC